jgi:hypothetical protein
MHHMKIRKTKRFRQDIHHVGGGTAIVAGTEDLKTRNKD